MSEKLPHNFFTIAGKAFIHYLDKMFTPFKDQLGKDVFPIMIKNTGDEAFLTNMNTDDLYSSVPRLTLDVMSIGLVNDQLTNHFMHGKASMNNDAGFPTSKMMPVRRVPINWQFNSEVVFNNVLEYLSFVDVLLTVSHHNHYFEFYYLGNVYTGTFQLPEDFDSEANSSLGFDSEKRRRILPLMFTLQLQFPAYDFYNINQYMDPEILSASNSMHQIIHKIHIDDTSEDGVLTITEIPQNNE